MCCIFILSRKWYPWTKLQLVPLKQHHLDGRIASNIDTGIISFRYIAIASAFPGEVFEHLPLRSFYGNFGTYLSCFWETKGYSLFTTRHLSPATTWLELSFLKFVHNLSNFLLSRFTIFWHTKYINWYLTLHGLLRLHSKILSNQF